jgi:hypothetical protein
MGSRPRLQQQPVQLASSGVLLTPQTRFLFRPGQVDSPISMSLLLFIFLGAGCGWMSAASADGKPGGSVVAGAIGGLLLGLVANFVFGFLFFLVKVAFVVFGVLILLALLGAGDSD